MRTQQTRARLYLVLVLIVGLALAVSACASAPAATPTTAPTAVPTMAAAAPTATTAPVATPTVAAATPTLAATATKPAAAPTVAPTATAAPVATPTAAPTAVVITATGPTIDRIKKAGKLIVLTDATFKPMEYVDEKGAVVGADIDIAAELAKELGVKLEVQKTTWDAIFASLKASKGDVILSSVTITDARKKEMSFSKPYYMAGQVIAVRADNTTIKGPADLAGKVVGVQIDTTGQEAAEKIAGIKEIKKYDGGADTMLAVDSSRVDAAVMDVMVALAYVKEHPTVKVVDRKPFTTEELGAAVQLTATDLQLFINQALDKMKQDGRLDKIFAKYGLTQ